jgi:hypothetical protein
MVMTLLKGGGIRFGAPVRPSFIKRAKNTHRNTKYRPAVSTPAVSAGFSGIPAPVLPVFRPVITTKAHRNMFFPQVSGDFLHGVLCDVKFREFGNVLEYDWRAAVFGVLTAGCLDWSTLEISSTVFLSVSPGRRTPCCPFSLSVRYLTAPL